MGRTSFNRLNDINFCLDNTIPTRTVQCKPWINPNIKALLKEKKRVFRSGNREELKAVQEELRKKIREGKNCYRRKTEDQLQQRNVSEALKILKTISPSCRGNQTHRLRGIRHG